MCVYGVLYCIFQISRILVYSSVFFLNIARNKKRDADKETNKHTYSTNNKHHSQCGITSEAVPV